jgi:hypothetical protein
MWWILGISAVIFAVWVGIEMLIDKTFDNSDLGDSDYGC